MNGAVQNIDVSKCIECGKYFIEPVYVCSACGSEEFEKQYIEGEGKIYTYTVIRVAPEAFKEQVPYPMAVVELPYNLRLTARISLKDNEQISIGRDVFCVKKDEVGYWFELK
jgi:hypothetical protein